MIERMKKITFLVTQKEYDGFIAGLREQGVVHPVLWPLLSFPNLLTY